MSGEALSNLRSIVALLLLGVSLPCLAEAYARASFVYGGHEDAAPRKLVTASVVVAAILRWFVAPKQIVTMYIGYLLTQQAIELSAASHYGMGSLALYHALFAILPQDHRTLIWINAVLGVATIPLASAFAAKVLRSTRAGAIFAAMVAMTPLFIKNDASDANHVPCLWWMFGGLVLWEKWLDSPRGTAHAALATSTILLALSANARPEMPLLLPILIVLFTIALRPSRARLRDPALIAAAFAFAILVAPHAKHIFGAAAALEDRDSLPGTNAGGIRRLLQSVVSQNTVLTPTLYPVALAVLAAIGVFVPVEERSGDQRRDAETQRREESEKKTSFSRLFAPLRLRAFALNSLAPLLLLAAATIAIATYGLDLCRANMARVHVPGAMIVTMLAASGLAMLWNRLRHPAARAALVVIPLATMVPTATTLWAPTNEQAEEDLLREALSHLPKEPFTFVRMDRADRDRASPGSDFTHHHFPDYLVRPPVGPGRVSSIKDWIDKPDLDRPAFFYWGMRCHAEFRGASLPAVRGDALQPACATMRERFELDPVMERTVPNRGDVWLEYYGDAKELRLGLYRIRARSR